MSQPQVHVRTFLSPKQQAPEVPMVRVLASAPPRPYFDPWYMSTIPGGLRMVQIAASFAAFVCILLVNQAFLGTYIAVLSTIICFICSLVLFIVYLFNLVQLVNINWIFYELIYCGVAVFLFVLSSLVMVYSAVRWTYAVWIAAAFFCLVSLVLYIIDFVRLLKIMNANNLPGRISYAPAPQSDQIYRS